MKKMVVVAALLLASIGVQGPRATSAQSVGCWGDWCSGQNPLTTHCADDATTTAWLEPNGARLEVRWSATCKTNWAKFIVYPQGWAILANNFSALVAEQDTGYQQITELFVTHADYTSQDGDITVHWTPMIYSPNNGVRARLTPSCASPSISGCVLDLATADQPTTNYG